MPDKTSEREPAEGVKNCPKDEGKVVMDESAQRFARPVSMYSFDNVVKKTKGVVVFRRKVGNCPRVFVKSGAGEWQGQCDDFGTTAFYLVERLRGLHPELKSFASASLISMGEIPQPIDLFERYAKEELREFLDRLAPTFSGLVADYDALSARVKGGDQLAAFEWVEVVANIFHHLRFAEDFDSEGLEGPEYPPAEGEDLIAVLAGEAEGTVVFRSAPRPPVKQSLTTLWPQGSWRGNSFIMRQKFDPFVLIGSRRLTTDETNFEVVARGTLICNPAREIVREIPANPTQEVASTGLADLDPAIDEGVKHVLRYASTDMNGLSPEAREEALYGNEQCKRFWELGLSEPSRKGLLKSLGFEPKSPQKWISVLAEYLSSKIQAVDGRYPSPQEVCLLAGARTIATKGQLRFGPNIWCKK